jgi:hypothetical protein
MTPEAVGLDGMAWHGETHGAAEADGANHAKNGIVSEQQDRLID